MKKYESYKETNIQWLGKIPSHWNTIKFKRLFSFGRGLSITKADLVDEGVPVISYGQIHSKQNTGTNIENHLLRYIPDTYIEGNDSSKVSKGDFIFADTSEDLEGCGNCVYIDKDYQLYAGYHSIIARNIKFTDAKYLAYLFKTDCWRSQIRSSVNGVKVFSITQNTLSDTDVLIPSFTEQQAIASYLDYKVGQIDSVIAEKEKMLDDLKVYRSSVISEAVTKGLDKNVPMKDSGIEWLGMIPYYWSLIKMKFISNLQSGSNLTSEEIMESGLYPVYGGNGIRGYFNEYNTEGSFVLIGRQGALCGNINYADGKFWATEHAVVCHPRTEYDVVWFGSLLEIMNLNQYSISSAQPGLSVERIENLLIPIPPIEEQKRIGEYIGVKGKTIELAINELLSQIEDLKSYKSSVITEAVTGKVDLREWNKQIVTA